METTEAVIIEQFLNELKHKGIRIGNKVKLRNGTVSKIRYIDPYEPDFPIVLMNDSSNAIDGSHQFKGKSEKDIIDWGYRESEAITPNHPTTTDTPSKDYCLSLEKRIIHIENTLEEIFRASAYNKDALNKNNSVWHYFKSRR